MDNENFTMPKIISAYNEFNTQNSLKNSKSLYDINNFNINPNNSIKQNSNSFKNNETMGFQTSSSKITKKNGMNVITGLNADSYGFTRKKVL